MKFEVGKNRVKMLQFFRYCVVGGLATIIHLGVYALLQMWAPEGSWLLSAAYTVGYLVALVCNFYLTTYFTFRTEASTKKAVGFGFSHLVNYGLHMILFNLNLWFGVHRLVAPLFVLLVAVPTNFVILRFFYSSRSNTSR